MSQSPNTPKRIKSFFCFCTCSAAYRGRAARNLATQYVCRALFCHKRQCKPCMPTERMAQQISSLDLMMMSFADFIDGMTNVNIAIGIRGAIMQNEFFSTFACFPNFLVKLLRLPLRQPCRLTLRQVAPHGKNWFQANSTVFIFFVVSHDLILNSIFSCIFKAQLWFLK